MKIGENGVRPVDVYRAQARESEKSGARPSVQAGQGDRLEISREGLALSSYVQEIKVLPDVREDLVARIKAQIAKGKYEPSPEEIASGMLAEFRLDRKV